MLAVMLLLVLAINGGLFTGTIIYTLYHSTKLEQTINIVEKLWTNPLA
jgi:hypothetical protein